MGLWQSAPSYDLKKDMQKKREEQDLKNHIIDEETRDRMVRELIITNNDCVTISEGQYGWPIGFYNEASLRRTCDFLSQSDKRFTCTWSKSEKHNYTRLTYCYK